MPLKLRLRDRKQINYCDGDSKSRCFEKLLLEVADEKEVQISRDGSFALIVSHSTSIAIKEIEDEEPYLPESTTHIPEMKLEAGNNSDNFEELSLVLRSGTDSEANASNVETQILLLPDTSMASDITEEEQSNIAEAGPKIGEKRYKCSHCSYATSHRRNFLTHNRTHTGDKPYTCDQCSFAAPTRGHLKIHMRTHSGEKSYKAKCYMCDRCSFASGYLRDLKRHMRTHTGEKPYKCSQCSYAATQAIHLKRHIRTHTGEKPYKCNLCSYAFAQHSNLKGHISHR